MFKPRLIRVRDFNEFELTHMLQDKYLELLVDTKKKKVYHVDPPLGHAGAAAIHLGIRKEDINDKNASHLVPALVEIEKKLVKNIMIGRSSLELGSHVHHTKTQLAKAQIIIEKIVFKSEQLHEVNVIKDLRKHELILD